MRLGKCIDLTTLTPSIIYDAGATGTWTAADLAHGTWAVHLPAGRDCGGDPESTRGPSATCDLVMHGCGKVKISISGTSGDTFASPTAYAQLLKADGTFSAQTGLTMGGSSGGTGCLSVPLTGDSEVTFQVTCGWVIRLSFDAGYVFNAPASDATFTAQILP